MNRKRLFKRLYDGSLQNVSFTEFVNLIEGFGFYLHHVRGSHHIFRHASLQDRLSLQHDHGEAKPYQIREFLGLVERYNLELED
jgi:predicted RNA binding protein YcfA (HicA-like mRNA interferase family)